MTNIIAIVNQKGGVGKTTTCANLGIGLALAGKKVLLVDGDPQGSLSISLGNPQPDRLSVSLATVLTKVLTEEAVDPKEGILHHNEGVDLMPANIELSGTEVSLVNVMSREKVLKQYLDIIKREYDYILLDCMPSLGMLTVNALAAADSVLIPVQAQYLPAKGLEQLLQTINKVRRQINPRLTISGLSFTYGTQPDIDFSKLIIAEAYGVENEINSTGKVTISLKTDLSCVYFSRHSNSASAYVRGVLTVKIPQNADIDWIVKNYDFISNPETGETRDIDVEIYVNTFTKDIHWSEMATLT